MTITVFAVLTRALGFLFRIFLAWQLGSKTLGAYQVAFSFFAVLLSLVASGVPLVISAVTAKKEVDGDLRAQQSLTSSGLIISVGMSLAVVFAVILLKRPIMLLLVDEASYTVLLCLLPAVFFSGVGAAFRGNIWGRRLYTHVSVIELFEQIIRILTCTVVCLVLSSLAVERKANVAALSLGVACVVSTGAMAFVYFKGGYKLTRPTGIRALVKSSAPITIVKVASCFVNLIIAVLLPLRLVASGMTKPEAMSCFGESVGMAFGFLMLPLTLTGSLSMALVPELSGGMQACACDKVRREIEQAMIFATIVSSVFVPLFASLGPQIGDIVYHSYRSGVFLSKAAIIMIPIAIEQIASSMMNSLGLEKRAFVNFMIGTAALIVLLWFLPAVMGIASLIVAMGASYGISTILHIVAMRERLNISLKFVGTICLSFVLCIPATFLGKWVYNILSMVFPTLLAVILSGLASMLCILLSYLLADILKVSGFKIEKGEKKEKSAAPRKRTKKERFSFRNKSGSTVAFRTEFDEKQI